MRNQLTDASIDGFIARSARLSAGAAPLWGGMSATGVPLHAGKRANTGAQAAAAGITFKERLLRQVFHLLPKLPRGINSGKAFVPTPDEGLQFTAELLAYTQRLQSFKTAGDIRGLHPVFGPLNTLEWRRFVYLHTDHHLRQFGV